MRYILSYILIFLALASSAQLDCNLKPTKRMSQYVMRHWDEQSGLGSRSVNAVLQTQNGYIWSATYDGLVRFDGVRFKVFRKNDGTGLSSSNILSLDEDDKGQLWVGSQHGVQYYKNGLFICPEPLRQLADMPIETILSVSSEEVWISTRDNQLLCYEKGKLKDYTDILKFSENLVQSIYRDSNGNMWFGTDKSQVWVLGSNTFERLGIPDVNGVNSFFESAETMYIATGLGVLRCDKDVVRPVVGLEELATNQVFTDTNGLLWAATDNGIYRINQQTNQKAILSEKNGLPNNIVTDIICDGDGNLWAATYRDGLVQLMDGIFTVYSKQEGLASNLITGISQLNDSTFLFGDENARLFTLCNGKIARYGENLPLPRARLKHLLYDSQGRLWVSTYGGLLLKEGNKSRLLTKATGLPDNIIRFVYEAKDSTIWVGTKHAGLLRYQEESKTFKVYDRTMGLSSNYLMDACEDKKGNLVLASMGGLSFIRNDTVVKVLNASNGLPSNFSFSVTADDNGIWIASNDGVWLYDYNKVHVFDVSNGLPYESFFNLLDDGKGNFWMPGAKSIVRVAKKQLLAVSRGEQASVEFDQFGKGNGLKNSHCIGAVHSYVDNKQNIWIPTQDGIAFVKPSSATKKHAWPAMHVEQVKADKTAYHWPSKVDIPANTHRINFQFTAIDFRSPEKLRFRYKLRPYETEWTEAEGGRVAPYTNLWPGDYTFCLQSTHTGDWPDEELQVPVHMNAAWWQTIFFYVALVLVVAVLLWFFIKFRMYRMRRRQEELEQLVKKRTSEVEQQKEELLAQADHLSHANHEINQKNEELKSFNDKIQEQKLTIERASEQVHSSIRYAESIQRAILPSNEYLEKYFEHFVLYKPKDIVSGDFYWLTKPVVDSQQRQVVLAAVVDCTGHGVPGGFVSMIGYQLLNLIVFQKGLRDVDAILEELNKEVIKVLQQKDSSNKDGMDVCLCSIELNDKATSNVDFCGAKRPLLYTQAGQVKKLGGTRRSIGGDPLYDNDIPFEKHSLELDKGTMLYLTSDGLADQPNQKRKSFGSKRFIRVLEENHPFITEKQLLRLNKELDQHQGETEQRDDISVLGIRL